MINSIFYDCIINVADVHRGEVINGGFGLVLDGSQSAAKKAKQMLDWDVSNGVARRFYIHTFS